VGGAGADRRPAEFDLCRCGRSSRKPFWTHRTRPQFDGTEVADRRPRAERVRVLEGDGVR
jgi:CDGSH-type Zn-finger protein